MIPSDCCTTDPCCDDLYQLASSLAHTVAAALVECQPARACDDLDVFVSHSRPIGPGHYVSAWLIRQRFTTSRVGLSRPVPTFGVRYVEPGFPRLEMVAGKPSMPDRALLDGAARHSYSHGMVMADAVRSTVAGTRFGGCDSVTIDRLEPDPIAAGFGGWTVEATWGALV